MKLCVGSDSQRGRCVKPQETTGTQVKKNTWGAVSVTHITNTDLSGKGCPLKARYGSRPQ